MEHLEFTAGCLTCNEMFSSTTNILLSKSQVETGRTAKQEQDDNPVGSVLVHSRRPSSGDETS